MIGHHTEERKFSSNDYSVWRCKKLTWSRHLFDDTMARMGTRDLWILLQSALLRKSGTTEKCLTGRRSPSLPFNPAFLRSVRVSDLFAVCTLAIAEIYDEYQMRLLMHKELRKPRCKPRSNWRKQSCGRAEATLIDPQLQFRDLAGLLPIHFTEREQSYWFHRCLRCFRAHPYPWNHARTTGVWARFE